MRRKVLSQQTQINLAVRFALQKKTATDSALSYMVRYANGYYSGYTCHTQNSNNESLYEVILKFGSFPAFKHRQTNR